MADTIPGNTMSTATVAVNSHVNSAIDFYGDVDWWRVALTRGYGFKI